jgi:hypothetical protein
MSGPGRLPDAEDAHLPVGTIRLMPMLPSLSNAEVSPNIVLRTTTYKGIYRREVFTVPKNHSRH